MFWDLLPPRAALLGEQKKVARDHFDAPPIDAEGDDPFYGSSFFRERHQTFFQMDGFDYDAIASEDFGAIWAVRNSVAAASWTILDVYRDPALLADVRAEVDACACALEGADGRIQLDVDKLLRLPILQAVYAETLRLLMHSDGGCGRFRYPRLGHAPAQGDRYPSDRRAHGCGSVEHRREQQAPRRPVLGWAVSQVFVPRCAANVLDQRPRRVVDPLWRWAATVSRPALCEAPDIAYYRADGKLARLRDIGGREGCQGGLLA
ncbi:uncharacterized protein GGS25DRAFT_519029 [Hypoxylon fragiforme]|uniref:uncharacterized protein n=1 Tax=Hypoxylon fragiforme TaxID=63214 RepID=UPI0020C668A0|nr:uncharacterized protein GGS25DRAFT_519029 [Hypoxylon fragiforme]KAI2610731.1 hypothetical protein GGS25DRAFT_519029 [Hypoxylon fragiforme]